MAALYCPTRNVEEVLRIGWESSRKTRPLRARMNFGETINEVSKSEILLKNKYKFRMP